MSKRKQSLVVREEYSSSDKEQAISDQFPCPRIATPHALEMRRSRANETPEQMGRRRVAAAVRYRAVRSRRPVTEYTALMQNKNGDETPLHYIGKLDAQCNFYRAKQLQAEMPQDKKFNVCCNKGKVKLPEFTTNEYIKNLM